MNGTETDTRRVLAVRCPAWPVPAQPPGQRPAQSSRRPLRQPLRQPPAAGPELRAFERVMNAVQGFCPRIEVLRPGICAFSARGPARYFGGEEELARMVADAVSLLGFDCGIGVADGMFAALLASRDSLQPPALPQKIISAGGTPEYLAPRSVTVLGEPDLADLLVRLGIRTLGEFAALRSDEVGNRFGTPGMLAHRLSRGLDPRPLAAGPPPADLSVQVEFEPPAEQSEQVVFAAKTAAGQMHDQLAASGLACVRIEITVSSDDGREISRLWRHDGLLTELAIAERVRWQLDGWRPAAQDEGIQAGGITLLRLIPDQLVRDHGRQLGLWGDALVSDRVARAAVRVQAMLGHDAVRQPVRSGGRSPADQAALIPFGDPQPVTRPVDRPWPGQIPPPAPATVYPAPRPAAVTDATGNLVTVTGRGHVSADPAALSVAGGPRRAITGWTGPWPVTERWWDPEHACRKARFQLVTVDGAAWLAVVQDSRWLIEASYD